MPTPFTHLVAAYDLLASADWPRALQRVLAEEQSAFLLGNIAPDVQTISGQPREATHFFPVPIGGAPPAHTVMFAQHPALARPRALSPAQAAFMAGYLAHLAFDQLWIADIFAPVFGPEQRWATFGERLYLHNALRAYMDGHDLAQLPPEAGGGLHAARPRQWLPFVADDDLGRWRDLVAEQLAPGGAVRTVEVFAERMRADPRSFAALVTSPDAMQDRVFVHVSLERLDQYRARALAQSAQLMQAYWDGQL